MSLRSLVHRALQPNGPMSGSVQGFSVRAGQLQMAGEVADTIETGGALVVEAGTGIGKTFAYLIPVLLSGESTLVSTATKALQDQLFKRDLPGLMSALGVSSRLALLKGRSSYLCLHRLDFARFDALCNAPESLRQLAGVERWALTTRTGDLAELDGLDERSPVIPLVTSTRDNCLGSLCPQVQSCHVNQARREAMSADVVVVNHHLFFADLNVRESGVAELLPTVGTVVFDEAHQLNEIGVQFLGLQMSTGQFTSFGADVNKLSLQHARGLAPWNSLTAELEACANDLGALCTGPAGRRSWGPAGPQGVDPKHWASALAALSSAVAGVQAALAMLGQTAPELGALADRGRRLMGDLQAFEGGVQPGHVRWLDIGSQVRMVQSPLDIASAMQAIVGAAPQQHVRGRAWIFTSATLGHEAGLDHFVQACGLAGARVLQVDSPFDYAKQAAVYVPLDMPKPADAAHSAAVADLVIKAATRLGGRTLVLTTTLRAMRNIGNELRCAFVADGDAALRVLVQGEASKRELVAQFNRASASGEQGCVLVASVSFWEGIDIPGDALQLLVIDKLPFSPPDDPLQQARALQLESLGKSAFKEMYLPQAALALKQGAGRLIRRETDVGVLVVCDIRLTQMGYGKKILKALPPMRRIQNEGEFLSALDSITRLSTTDPSAPLRL